MAEDIARARRQDAEAGNCLIGGSIVQVHNLLRLHEHWVVRRWANIVAGLEAGRTHRMLLAREVPLDLLGCC